MLHIGFEVVQFELFQHIDAPKIVNRFISNFESILLTIYNVDKK